MTHSERSSPFVSLQPFTEGYTSVFSGRTCESRQLLWMVLAYPDVLVLGRSGVGKTSLVRAGLIPSLQQEGHHVLPVVSLTPPDGELTPKGSRNPFVITTLLTWGIEESDISRDTTEALFNYFGSLKHFRTQDGEPRLCIAIFDQLEKMFFSGVREVWRKDFFHQVCKIIEEYSLLRLLLVLREDYLAPAEIYANLFPNRLRIQLRLGRLDRKAALDVIKEPSAKSGYVWGSGVAETLVDQLTSEEEFIEPVVLQLVCYHILRAAQASGSGEVSQSLLNRLGDVQGILSKCMNDVIKQTAEQTSVAQSNLRLWIRENLVSLAGTRLMLPLEPEITRGLANEVIDILINSRLIRCELREGKRWIELSDDLLVDAVRK